MQLDPNPLAGLVLRNGDSVSFETRIDHEGKVTTSAATITRAAVEPPLKAGERIVVEDGRARRARANEAPTAVVAEAPRAEPEKFEIGPGDSVDFLVDGICKGRLVVIDRAVDAATEARFESHSARIADMNARVEKVERASRDLEKAVSGLEGSRDGFLHGLSAMAQPPLTQSQQQRLAHYEILARLVLGESGRSASPSELVERVSRIHRMSEQFTRLMKEGIGTSLVFMTEAEMADHVIARLKSG